MHMGDAMMKLFKLFVVLLLIGAAKISQVEAASLGEKILKERCSSCHNLTGPEPATLGELRGRKGPDLFYAGNKYRAEWITEWLQSPQRLRPAGVFYPDHVKLGEEGDEIDATSFSPHPELSKEEAKAVAESLMGFKAKSLLINQGEYKPGKIPLMMGELLFDKFRGCLACHQIEPGYGGLSGPEVYTAADRLQDDYLLSFMRDPQAWNPKTLMPDKHLKESDLQKLVHYLHALKAQGFKEASK